MFESKEAVKNFVGDDYETFYVPDKAKEILLRHDNRSQHYEVLDERVY